ncbi:MAG: 16S rRNA (adenine(1518)-N(6)/adenine(1519)-N(6))-dimethyltransferase RsmA [Candidatus Paceibacterota bacterium]
MKNDLSKTSEESFQHKKSLGQNFLTSDIVPNWMCEAAKLEENDTILEIGPGTGMLTKSILQKSSKVLAVETDKRAVEKLKETFSQEIRVGKLTIIEADIKNISLKDLGLRKHKFKVVANIPYYLSGFLLRFLLENDQQPKSVTFLIQKELAERIARSKKESILSLSVKVFGEPRYIKTVTKGHFKPQPKVDSAILQIDNINNNNFTEEISIKNFFKILHLGLGNKRKQLLSNLSKKYSRSNLEATFSELSINNKIRGEDLPLQQWLILTKALK